MLQAGRRLSLLAMLLAPSVSGCGGDSDDSGARIHVVELPGAPASDNGTEPSTGADTHDAGRVDSGDPGNDGSTPDAKGEPADVVEPTTDTTEPPADTTEPPTDATEPPTDTTEPPTDTTEPPTDTTEPPTDTAEPPADTPEPPRDVRSDEGDQGPPDAGPELTTGHWRCVATAGVTKCEPVYESLTCGDGYCRVRNGESPWSCPADCAGDPGGPPCVEAADCIFLDWPHAATGFWTCEAPSPSPQPLCVAYASSSYCSTAGYDWCAEEWGESPASCPADCAPGAREACEEDLDCVFEDWPATED